MISPRVLLLDIETAPIIAAIWNLFEANAVWVERDTHLLCFAAKWLDERSVKTFALTDYPSYKRDKHNDKSLVRDLCRLLDEADIVVAHNGDSFDIKKIRARMAVHGFPPPSPFKTIDTLKISRRFFKFDSNKLDNLGRYLHEGRKLPNTGGHLWRSCCDGDVKAWRTMRRYNAQDVRLLERVYNRLKPWAQTGHPDLSAYGGACPRCQSVDAQSRGTQISIKRRTHRWQCNSCAHWFSTPMRQTSEIKNLSSASRSKTAPLRGSTGLGRRNRNRATQ
jgi:hypothetical protein